MAGKRLKKQETTGKVKKFIYITFQLTVIGISVVNLKQSIDRLQKTLEE